MATYKWSIAPTNVINGLTYIKDTDNKLQATMDDLVEFVNGEGNHAGQGLAYDFVKKDQAATITAPITFNGGLTSNTTIAGSVNGNANTATALETPRTISLSGSATGSVLFDGTSDVIINTSVTNNSHRHTVSNIDSFQENVQEIVGRMVSNNTETGISVEYRDTDKTLDFALTADPTITLSGDVSGSATMTNLGSVNITTTVADDSHNHTISNIDGLQTALNGKQAVGSYVTTGSIQALHPTDALRISGSTVYLVKGDGAYETVTLPSFNAGKYFGTNGYQKFSNGLIIQWGGTPSQGTVTYPIAFPNAVLSIAICRSGNTSADGNNVPEYSSLSKTSFYYQAGISGKYIAIGC